jgi:hypothetical protein
MDLPLPAAAIFEARPTRLQQVIEPGPRPKMRQVAIRHFSTKGEDKSVKGKPDWDKAGEPHTSHLECVQVGANKQQFRER